MHPATEETLPPAPPVAPHDLRMLVPAAVTWLTTWVATAEQGLLVGAVVLVGLVTTGLAARRRSALLGAVALLLVAGSAVGVLRVQALRSGPLPALAADEAMVEVEVVTGTDLQVSTGPGGDVGWVRGELRRVQGRGQDHRLRAPVVVLVTGERIEAWRGLVAGSRVRAEARLAGPDRGSDVAAVVRIRGAPELVAPPGPGLLLVERVRAGLRDAVGPRTEEQRALVPALVLGDTSAMTEELEQRFAATGLVHLTAVSGANLTLLLVFLLGLARAVGVRGWWLRLLGLLGVGVFVALCRTEPSVLRAAAMGLVALAALGLGGRGERRGLRHLCVAVTVLLLLDPWLSRSAGMALSVLASAGIVWWAGRWAAELSGWLPRWVAESVAVPLAAQLATQPVATAISGQVSAAGLVANMAAAPFVGPATVLGFAAAGASLLWAPLAEFVALGAALSAQGILVVADVGASLPGALWVWPVTPWSVAVLVAGCVLVAAVVPVLLRRWWACLLLAVLMVLALLRSPVQPGWPPERWFLVACDVGQGDAVLLRAGVRAAVVVDAGPDPVAVDRCLSRLGVVEVPLLVLSHFHADHVDGLPGVLGGRRVGAVLVSPLAQPLQQHRQVQEQLAAAGLSARVAVPGSTWQVGEVSWRTLGPAEVAAVPLGDDGSGESPAENDASVVALATVSGVRVLLTGDIGAEAQQRLVGTAGLEADVLKVPHHGSADQDPGFLRASGAALAVASAGRDNSYGHPAARTLQLLETSGTRVLRTDTSGSVALSGGPDAVRVTTER
ncbi:ComEC/Rec2 family competence protein [Auraticoccus monumenti]|uniref:Competence protein ComEC n=1 Tax=Auraticoccus monumenti TaxID=675864 RepID=A0A1G7EID6_9ACTN|nr:ComEC/Rec2 family competence protein [Auraticoccus monumenti]SDE63413.1 competence protein ComEC [Auraticoccus monumenti]